MPLDFLSISLPVLRSVSGVLSTKMAGKVTWSMRPAAPPTAAIFLHGILSGEYAGHSPTMRNQLW